MVNWKSPEVIGRNALAFMKLIHVLLGMYCWECPRLRLDIPHWQETIPLAVDRLFFEPILRSVRIDRNYDRSQRHNVCGPLIRSHCQENRLLAQCVHVNLPLSMSQLPK